MRALKAEATTDLYIGGGELAAEAFRAGLVDDVHLMVAPVVVGGGKPVLPKDLRIDLELVEIRRFEGTGVVSLRYRVGRPA